MINADTRVYGLFGYPVRHTFSPVMHNAAFRAIGLNSAYLAFEVEPEKIGNALKGIVALGIEGVNLTVPHKERALVYMDKLSPEARLIGAVNTVVRRGKKLIGHNTDGAGFVASLKKDARLNPRGKNIFILGAGGAARAIAMELAKKGASRIVLTDLVYHRAQNLALKVRQAFSDCTVRVGSLRKKEMTRNILDSDLLINATPIGMNKSDPLLVDEESLHPDLVVCDLIYNPLETKLLKCARARKLKTISGLGMLLYQGAISFKLWTGRKAPIEVMRKALLKQINLKK